MKAKTIRNAQIVADAGAGMPLDDLVRKYQLGRDYLGTLIRNYTRPDRVQQVIYTVFDESALYVDRDKTAILALAARYGTVGRIVSVI